MNLDGRKVTLRLMKVDDVDRVYEIECLSFARPWTRDSFVSEVTSNVCARYVVVEEDGRVVGYGGMWLIIDEAHVNNIAIDPSYRGRGYGRLLMKELMRVAYSALEICQMTLEVRVSNDAAIKLYTSMGFDVAGTRKGYYDDTGEDAYVMWCHNTIVNLI
jgi:[ribosomal protein S18]-alanine N-acetyltransferase